MSLGRKTKAYVASMAYQLGEADSDTFSDNVLLAMKAGVPLSDAIKNMVLKGTANKARQARAYAQNYYTLGLPSGNFKSFSSVTNEELATIIATDTGYTQGVIVDYFYVEPLIPAHLAQEYLLLNRDWNQANSTISIFPDDIVYPVSPTPMRFYPVVGEEDVWAENPVTYVCELVDITTNTENTVVTIEYTLTAYQDAWTGVIVYTDDANQGRTEYCWINTIFDTQSITEEFPIPSNYILGAEYYIVKYKKINNTGFEPLMYTWYYPITDKTYPVLNETVDDITAFSGLPVIPLRYNNVDMAADDKLDTDLYKTSNKLLNILGTNMQSVAASINDSDSVADIDHAYIMFGIDIQTEEQSSLKYLVHFFDTLADQAKQTQISGISDFLLNKSSITNGIYSTTNQYSGVGNELSLTENGLNIWIKYNWIKSELRVGNIGTIENTDPAEIGFVMKKLVRQSSSNDYLMKTTGTSYEDTDHNFAPSVTIPLRDQWDKSRLILRMQIDDNIYHYVEVEGLSHFNRIYQTKDVCTTLTNIIDDVDDHNLIIPVDYYIAMNLGILDRNDLYAESLQLIMNSVKMVKEEWYQATWFQIVIQLVSFVVMYFSVGTLSTLLNAAIQSLAAFIQFMLLVIIGGYVLKAAFAWLASIIGAEWMAIISAVVSVVSIYLGYNHPMIFSIGTAQACLQISLAMMEGTTLSMQNQVDDITQEYNTFTESASEKMEVLTAAQELLEIDPLGADLLWAQTHTFQAHPLSNDPELFFNTTIHTGNIGTLVLDIIPQYHTIALTLPTANESLGMGSYAPAA